MNEQSPVTVEFPGSLKIFKEIFFSCYSSLYKHNFCFIWIKLKDGGLPFLVNQDFQKPKEDIE